MSVQTPAATVRGQPRVAWVSPFPPDRGGIADYSANIVQALKGRARVDLWTDEPLAPPLSTAFRVVDYRREPTRTDELENYDAVIYNVGNHPEHHGSIVDLLARHPGVVVLHDMALNNLFLGHLGRARYVRRMLPRYGAGGAVWFSRNAARYFAARTPLARRLVPGGFAFSDQDRYPFTEDVVAQATGIVVHSDHVRRQLVSRGAQCPISTIRHPVFSLPPEVRALGPRPEEVPGDRTLLVAVGDVVPYKQIHVLVEALAQDSHLRERCALRVIGRKFPDFYPVERRARELGLTDCVRFLGYQPVEVMYAYLAAADVYLGLRHPTEGETSGALIRALERGRTAVVSDNGWYAELPDDCVVKVEAPVRVEELRRVLRALVEDSGRRREIGARAAAHVRSEYSLGTFVERILAFSVGS